MTDGQGRSLSLGGADWVRLVLFILAPLMGVGTWMVKGQYETGAAVERLRDGQEAASNLAKTQFESLGRRIDRIERREDHWKENQ